MADELLEAEAIEEDAPVDDRSAVPSALPVERGANSPSVWRGEARSVAMAAAGGIVAGAATVAVAKAASRASAPAKRSRGILRRRQKPAEIVASRSFLVDVHLLGR